MKIAKEFRWEMGHRLPEHFGKCKNIHGHSYKMIIELEGEVGKSGMVMDYYDVKKILGPVIEKLDHAFMVCKEDKETISFLKKMKSKIVIVNFNPPWKIYAVIFLMRLKRLVYRKILKKFLSVFMKQQMIMRKHV